MTIRIHKTIKPVMTMKHLYQLGYHMGKGKVKWICEFNELNAT